MPSTEVDVQVTARSLTQRMTLVRQAAQHRPQIIGHLLAARVARCRVFLQRQRHDVTQCGRQLGAKAEQRRRGLSADGALPYRNDSMAALMRAMESFR